MSRIGKQPVPVPSGVDVTIDGQKLSVKGPKGTLDLAVAEPITVARNDDGAIVVSRPDDERRSRSLHGLSRTLVANLITGVTEGYTTKMEIFGVGYRVALKGASEAHAGCSGCWWSGRGSCVVDPQTARGLAHSSWQKSSLVLPWSAGYKGIRTKERRRPGTHAATYPSKQGAG